MKIENCKSLMQSSSSSSHADCRGYPYPNEYPGNDIKQPAGEAPVMLDFGGMRSSPSWLLLPGLIWPGVVAPDRVLSMGQIEMFDI